MARATLYVFFLPIFSRLAGKTRFDQAQVLWMNHSFIHAFIHDLNFTIFNTFLALDSISSLDCTLNLFCIAREFTILLFAASINTSNDYTSLSEAYSQFFLSRLIDNRQDERARSVGDISKLCYPILSPVPLYLDDLGGALGQYDPTV